MTARGLGTMTNAAGLFAKTDEYLKRQGLRFARIEEKKIFHFYMESVQIMITCHDGAVCVYALCSDKVPTDKRSTAMNEIAKINYKLDCGNWEIDLRDGEIRFKLCICFEGLADYNDLLELYISLAVKAYQNCKDDILSPGLSSETALLAGLLGLVMDGKTSAGGSSGSSGAAAPPRGDTPLIEAARENDISKVKSLLSSGANPNATNNEGTTALMAAAVKGHTALCQVLIEKRANVNMTNNNHDTALSLAVFKQHPECAAAILKLGGDPNHVDKFGDTPLLDAAANGYTELVKLLLAKGAKKSHTNNAGKTAATRAREGGHISLAAYLA